MDNTKICWIIRFTDGTLASYYGAKDGAIAKAEGLKDLYGGDYIITEKIAHVLEYVSRASATWILTCTYCTI